MPTIVIPLTLLGLVPLVFFACGAVGPSLEPAERMLVSLIDYAALILAFAGGVHWGLALLPGLARTTTRFLSGVLPMVVAWVGLILAQLVSPSVSLAVLIAGYLGTVLTEHRAARSSLIPSGYLWMRWLFSVVSVLMMAMVLVLRGIGQTIVF
jgi:predicted membrane-bound spermidine synthase